MQTLNLGVRFALELCALVIYGYWGFSQGNTKITQWIFGFGISAMVAAAWGIFGSPKASVQLSQMSHLLFEIVIFGLPVILLFALGKPTLAAIYGIAAVINKILMLLWNQ